MDDKITVFGGGPAGLAVAYYLTKAGFEVEVLEAAPETGGNCRTIELEGFRFDTGAHRFHNKDPEVTLDVKELLREGGLHDVDVPSRLISGNSYFYFPIRPMNALFSGGARWTLGVGVDFLRMLARRKGEPPRSFEEHARATYGTVIAEKFLLPYTEKLWGLPCEALSPNVGTRRLSGISPLGLLYEVILGKRMKSRHLDGRFLYPSLGYGSIAQALTRAIGAASIRCGCRIAALEVAGDRITAYTLADGRRESVSGPIVCTLPLTVVARMLADHLSAEASRAAKGLRFRALRLLFLALDRPSVSPDGSLYFPSLEVPFTRIHEPRNRSPRMSPPGKTSLLVEFPHFPGEEVGEMSEDALVRTTLDVLEGYGLVRRADLLFSHSLTLSNAYPVMEIGYEQACETILRELARFRNLRMAGRSGTFFYSHLHDMMRGGRDVAEEMARAQKVSLGPRGL